MSKRAVSVTLHPDNLTSLKARAEAAGAQRQRPGPGISSRLKSREGPPGRRSCGML